MTKAMAFRTAESTKSMGLCIVLTSNAGPQAGSEFFGLRPSHAFAL
jgi:hypothetical protein